MARYDVELGNGTVNVHTVPMRPEYGFRAEQGSR